MNASARGKVALAVTEIAEARLEVQRERVVDFALDLAFRKVRAEGVARRRSHDELVPRVIRCVMREREIEARERVAIARGDSRARRVPAIEVRELHAEDRRLDRVEPHVPPDALVDVLLLRAVDAQRARLFRERRVVRDDEPAVAERAEVLRRKKRDRRRACAAKNAATDALRRVDDRVRRSRSATSEEIDGDRRPVRDAVVVHVDERELRAGAHDRFRRRDERERGNGRFPHAACDERAEERIAPRRNPDRVRDPEKIGDFALERFNFGPEDETRRIDDSAERSVDFRAYRGV